MKLSKIHLFWL